MSTCRQPATVTLTLQFSASCAHDALEELAAWLADHGIETDEDDIDEDDLDEDNWASPTEDDDEVWSPPWDDELPDELDDHLMRSLRPRQRGRGSRGGRPSG